ncbi:MAG: class I SAM-dependent methyltransferase [Planctomycetota bacterium]
MSYELTEAGFRDATGALHRSVRTDAIVDEAALSKQEASLPEYAETHTHDGHDPAVRAVMAQFEGFVATHVLANEAGRARAGKPTLLDVGCGISPRIPPYLRRVAPALTYVGLDPLPQVPERDYLFVNGTFEGLHRHLSPRFDYLLFSTSLDHFPDLEQVAREVGEVLAPDGLALFWVGLHDPDVVARQALADRAGQHGALGLREALRAAAAHPLRLARLYRAIRARERKLAAGEALDPYHFHYFTREALERSLDRVGEVVDAFFPPLTNSAFYAVRLRRERGA